MHGARSLDAVGFLPFLARSRSYLAPGTRLIPEGALTGVQFMRTSAYVQVIGFIDQTKINIADGDFGGELDPHGADLVSRARTISRCRVLTSLAAW